MKINFIYDPNVSIEQMLGYEIAAITWGKLFTDNIEINILAQGSNELDENVIGGAIPEFHEQHYGLFLQYYEADITSAEDQAAFDALQEGNTIDFLLNGDLIGGNTKLKLTTALAKALGMENAISLDRYLLEDSDNIFDGTIMMNQNFAWDFNYLRDAEAAENTLDFLSVALHETGHILGFTSSLDFSLQQETQHSGREELSNFSPLDLFRFSAQSLTQENTDGAVNDLSIGGTAWFSVDGGETISEKFSTGKEGDGFQASHWERRYDPRGIMDPTLWYQERVEISDLDILAFDVMGYDLSETAQEVEELFTEQALEKLLAQAKVKLAHKLGISIAELEESAEVPITPLAIYEEMGIDYTAIPEIDIVNTSNTAISEIRSPEESDHISGLSEEAGKDFFKDLEKMMGNIYQWWSSNNSGKSTSWQELYEWMAANNKGKSAGWQELYEWMAANNRGKSAGWQELYEWMAANNKGKSAGWQELSEEERYRFHQEVTGEKKVWWEEVFFNTQESGDIGEVDLPGENHNLVIGPAAPLITGANQDEILSGNVGDDQIVGGEGDDLIDGAEGNDTVFGADGNDTVFAFDGNDSVIGGQGDDVISGESGDDVLFGRSGADILMGGENDDYLDGGAGRDFLNGQTGNDALMGGAGNDALEGESGKDLLVAGEGKDIANGGSGDDVIYGDEHSENFNRLRAASSEINSLTNLFVPAETPVIDFFLEQKPIKVEAESLSWSGNYTVNNQSYASGGSLINHTTAGQWLSGSTTFTGLTGIYDVTIGYHDINYDRGGIQFNVNDVVINGWNLSKNISSGYLAADNFTTKTISNVELSNDDSFSIESWVNEAGYGEGALDYIRFVPVASSATNDSESSNTNNVVLAQDPVRIEAENFSWSGHTKNETESFASGGSLVQNDDKGGIIAGSTTFNGQAGIYDVVIAYHDLKDEGQITFKLDGTNVESWILNQDSDDKNVEVSNFTTRTISNVQLDSGNTITIENIEDGEDKGYIDYIEFIPAEQINSSGQDDTSTDSSAIDNSFPTESNVPIRLEAESMDLFDGYVNEGTIIATNPNNITSIASTTFSGDLGFYKVVVRYVDENDGASSVAVKIDESEVDSWALDQNNSGSHIQFYNRTISEGMYIDAGDVIEIQANPESGEFARVDYLEFIPIENPNLKLDETSDVLRGGLGNDAIDGGTGNDVIFGEDEFDDSSYVVAPGIEGSLQYGHSSYVLSQAGSWEEAQAEAKSLGGNLVTINDAAEEQWLVNTFGFNNLAGAPYLSDFVNEGFWIGLTDKSVEGQWQWESGEVVTYSNQSNYSDVPDEEDYGVVSLYEVALSRSWFDSQRTHYGTQWWAETLNAKYSWDGTTWLTPGEHRGIIEIDWSSSGGNDTIFGGLGDDLVYGNSGNDTVFGDDFLTALPDGVIYNGSLYFPTASQMSWSEAQAHAEDFGGNLVTVNDASESAWLNSTFTDYGLWIGFTDEGTEGTWKWASGENSNFTDWHTGQPDGNNTAGQDYAVLNWGDEWKWDDQEPEANHHGLVEVDLPININRGHVYNGSIYLLTDANTQWHDAQAYAESLGGNLVTINNAQEGQWLKQTFTSENLWIGLTDSETEGTWKWASGEDSNFTDWSPGQPDNHGDSQDYAAMNYEVDGIFRWDDRSSYSIGRGIVEIKLPSGYGGNDTLTGNGGHDRLEGGAGDDVLNGTDEVVAGYLERDVLVGGNGSDVFILGNVTQDYYATGGDQDYAVIEDFDASLDLIHVNGSTHSLEQQGQDVHLATGNTLDLIAIIKNTTTSELQASGVLQQVS